MSNSLSQKSLPITRREISAGVAFAEEYDLHRLSQWPTEGWRLVKINSMSMILEQAPPEQVVFALDYQDSPDAKYFALCATAGWLHVISVEHVIHLFKAVPGTPAIFSETDTTVKYERAAHMFFKPALWSSIALVLSIGIHAIAGQEWFVARTNSVLAATLDIAAVIFMVLAGVMCTFTVLPWCAYRLRANGTAVRWNRLTFGIVFALCGAVIGYFLGLNIANRAGW
jgi:hypothetical protein